MATAARAGLFGKVKALFKYTWDNKGEIVLVGTAGSSIFLGWTYLLGPLSIFRHSERQFLYSPPQRPSDASVSCQEQGGHLVWHVLKQYLMIAPGTYFFLVAFNDNNKTTLLRRVLWDGRGPVALKLCRLLTGLGLASLPICLFNARPATLAMNRMTNSDFQQRLSLLSSSSSLANETEDEKKMSNFRQFGYGIYRISRQPHHVGPCLLAAAAMVRLGTLNGFLFFGLVPVYAILHSHFQDEQDTARIDPSYFDHTSNVPFAAILQGKNSLSLALSEIDSSQWFLSAVVAASTILY